jgi:hypothetical protein
VPAVARKVGRLPGTDQVAVECRHSDHNAALAVEFEDYKELVAAGGVVEGAAAVVAGAELDKLRGPFEADKFEVDIHPRDMDPVDR